MQDLLRLQCLLRFGNEIVRRNRPDDPPQDLSIRSAEVSHDVAALFGDPAPFPVLEADDRRARHKLADLLVNRNEILRDEFTNRFV